MNVQLKQVLGTWRHTNGNVIIDFNIRRENNDVNSAKAMFTIYQREPEHKIHYEWHGIIQIENQDNELPTIVISNINHTENRSEYENLKIWMFTIPGEMYLELGNGDKILFQMLGNIFS